MRRTFKYGFFIGMNPVCPARLAEYSELRYIADLTPEELRYANQGDLIDAQHQWAYSSSTRVMQHCFEENCTAVRPVPLDAYPAHDSAFILREFLRRSLPCST